MNKKTKKKLQLDSDKIRELTDVSPVQGAGVCSKTFAPPCATTVA